MMAWLYPIALAGLVVAVGPIAVHLLRRQRAPRLPFASLRFVHAARTAAVRMRLPSDIPLLILRMAIVCAAAAALAQPLLVTRARRALWDGRFSRAIVVDSSRSMAGASQRAAEAEAAEAQGAVHGVRITTERLRDGLSQAVTALAAAPPSRREIVVVSDFQHGSLTAAELTRVPGGIGLRFVNVGSARASGAFRGDASADAPGIQGRVPEIAAMPEGTAVRFTPADVPARGLRLLEAGDAEGPALSERPGPGESKGRLLRAVARAGAPAPSPEQPLAIAFATNSRNPANPTSPIHPWMLRTILSMRRDWSLGEAARDHRTRGARPASEWIVVARDASSAPVVLASADGNELVLHVAAAADEYLAAAVLRSALIARRGDPAWDEYEIEQIPASQLAAWTREAAPIDPAGWRGAAPGDARWVWMLVLGLLGLEAVVRRRARERQPEVYADVA